MLGIRGGGLKSVQVSDPLRTRVYQYDIPTYIASK